MAETIKIPVKTFPDGKKWLILGSVLGRRIIFRAHSIKLTQNVLDYDGHHNPEAYAKESVKCASRTFKISDKIIKL